MESSHVITSLAPTPEGQLIRRAREASIPKLSIRGAAGRVGLSKEHWGYIERGYRPVSGEPPQQFSPPSATLARMAYALGISPDRLETEGQRPDAAGCLREMPPPRAGDPAVPDRVVLRRVRPFIPYEIPLNDNERARLVLPEDLTQAEADRVCRVIQSLAFGERAENAPGG